MTVAPGRPRPTTAPETASSPWTAARVVAAVLASVVIVGSLAVGAGGVSLLVANLTLRDDAGFLNTPAQSFGTSTYAVTSGAFELHTAGVPRIVPRSLVGQVRISVESARGGDVFVGIAPATEAAGYLADVAHAEVLETRGWADGTRARYRVFPGGAPPTEPQRAQIWVAHAEGSGERSLVWVPQDGDWTLVVMNQDGQADVQVRATAGATVPALGPVAGGLLVAAMLGFTVAAVVLALTFWQSRRPAAPSRAG